MIGLLTNIESGDLQVANSTLTIGETTAQVAESVLRATPGEFKECPLIGAGLDMLRNGNADLMWCANTKEMLQACGVPARSVTFVDNIINIE